MSAQRVCGHCDKNLSIKAFKEHKRLYYHEDHWIRAQSSSSSSPLSLSNPPSDDSDPPSDDYSPDHSNCGFESDLDDDYTLNFEPGESNDDGMCFMLTKC